MKCKSILIVGIILLFSNKAFTQDTIYWRPDYRLEWKDFKGKIDATKKYGALSYTGILYKASYGINGLTFKVVSYFNRKESWVKLRSNIGLKHEQGHFNITELFTRKLTQTLENFVVNPSTATQDLKAIYLKIYNEKNKMQSLYDKETDFSRNIQMQEFWDKKIQQELKN
ncbi:MAG TPA: DUF922 domain-containing protein [Puia sp.]|nr:DUF922 domain-containing protein [Puia sp.]